MKYTACLWSLLGGFCLAFLQNQIKSLKPWVLKTILLVGLFTVRKFLFISCYLIVSQPSIQISYDIPTQHTNGDNGWSPDIIGRVRPLEYLECLITQLTKCAVKIGNFLGKNIIFCQISQNSLNNAGPEIVWHGH